MLYEQANLNALQFVHKLCTDIAKRQRGRRYLLVSWDRTASLLDDLCSVCWRQVSTDQ